MLIYYLLLKMLMHKKSPITVIGFAFKKNIAQCKVLDISERFLSKLFSKIPLCFILGGFEFNI